jgi:TRAP-type C4-dicarboxylate transport system substrate-binding protein
MKFRSFTNRAAFGVAALALSAAFAAPAAAEDYPAMNLRHAHFIPETYPQPSVEKWWAEEIAKRSGGKIKIQIFWNQAIAKAPEIADLVGSGGIAFGSTPPAYTPSKFPLFGGTNALPLVFTDIRDAVRVTRGMLELEPVKEEMKRNNVWPLLGHGLMNYRVLCTKPVAKIADFAGLKMRSYGAFQPSLWESLGAVGVVVLPSEVYEGLQRGRLDCGFYAPDNHVSAKLYEVAKYMSSADFGPLSAWPVFVNYDLWFNKWPENVRKLIADVSAEAQQRSLDLLLKLDAESIETLKAKGVKVVEFTEQREMEKRAPDFITMWEKSVADKDMKAEAKIVADYWRAEMAKIARK